MELSHSLIDSITKSSFCFAGPAQRLDLAKGDVVDDAAPASPSPIFSLGVDDGASKWRIDGATLCGTQFYAVPYGLLPDLVPRRIDVFIPDQKYISKQLRRALQTSLAVCFRDGNAIASLGISRHICHALDHWCDDHPAFLDEYKQLPFGSRLVFEEITADVKDMRLSIEPAHHLENSSLSISSLKKMWGDVQDHNWPESIDISRLRLKREHQDSISIVGIIDENHAMETDYVFKSNSSEFKSLYHELHFLLTCPPHPNVMGRPLFIVSKKSNFGGEKRGVWLHLAILQRWINQRYSAGEDIGWNFDLTPSLGVGAPGHFCTYPHQ